MLKASWASISQWAQESAWPFLKAWWDALDENPEFHFATAVATIALLYAIKFAAWMVM